MGLINDIKSSKQAIDKVDGIITYGHPASISDYEIVMTMTYMPDAQKLLDPYEFAQVNKKYQLYRESRQERYFPTTAAFRDRVAMIACEYSTCCEYEKVFATDPATQRHLKKCVSIFKDRVEKISEYLAQLIDLMLKYSNQSLKYVDIGLVSVYYFSAVISILVNGNDDCRREVLKGYLNQETHDGLREMTLWHSVKKFQGNVIRTVSRNYDDNSVVGSAVGLTTIYLDAYENIMQQKVSSIDKCMRLGYLMYSVCGLDVTKNNAQNVNLGSILNSFIDFVRNSG